MCSCTGSFTASLIALMTSIGIERSKQAGHVLEADGVRPHVLEDLRLLYEVVDCVDRPTHPPLGDRVADGALDVLASFTNRVEARLHVALVVERVEDAEYVDAGLRRLFAECANHVVGVVAVADEVLAA